MQTQHTGTVYQQWQGIRHKLIKSYYHLVGIDPKRRLDLSPLHFHRFCQILTDYLALGHFCIYQKHLEQTEIKQSELHKKSTPIYVALVTKTQIILDMIESFHHNPKEVLRRELSELGEAISELLELEDHFFCLEHPR